MPHRLNKNENLRIEGPIKPSNKNDKPIKLKSFEELASIKIEQDYSSWKVGRVKFFKKDEAYGYIECFDDKDCYIHVSQIKRGLISKNDYVIFRSVKSGKNKNELDAQELSKLCEFEGPQEILINLFPRYKLDASKRLIIDKLELKSISKVIDNELATLNKKPEKEKILELINDIIIFSKRKNEEETKFIRDHIIQKSQEPFNIDLKVYLWYYGFGFFPPVKELLASFELYIDEVQNKIINDAPDEYKLDLLQISSRKSDVKLTHDALLKSIRKKILDSGIIVFDLEFDGFNIREYAANIKGKLQNAIGTDKIKEALSELKSAVEKESIILAGHNIEQFDIPVLRKFINLPDDLNIIDTLLNETILSPTLRCFALDTKHIAKYDVENTLNLLVNQSLRLICISENQLKVCEKYFDSTYIKLIREWRNLFTSSNTKLLKQLSEEKIKYFINKDIRKDKSLEIQAILEQNSAQKYLLISPREFYPILSNINNIEFIGDNGVYSLIIDENKINQLPSGSIERYLLNAYIFECKEQNRVPLYVNLPGRVKILIGERSSKDFITKKSEISHDSKNHYCLTPENLVENLNQIRDLGRKVFVIEKDLISINEKTLIKTLDYTIFSKRFNSDAFWIYFTGGQSRVEITRHDLEGLGVTDISEEFTYFWIEKSSFDTFHIWGNYDLKNLLKKIIPDNNILEFAFTRNNYEKESCQSLIPKIIGGKAVITRYNPETRYRDRYWTFQAKLYSEIIVKSEKPTILIINLKKEKQKLYDYYTALNYYIPDLKASLTRQINLLRYHPSHKKLLVITKDQIPDVIQSEDLIGFNYIIDSFELEEKWFISKGSGFHQQIQNSESGIKFRDDDSKRNYLNEDEIENENSHTLSSSKDVFVQLRIQKPFIDYIRWLIKSADCDAVIWLADSRLGDFIGLEEEWNASKKLVSIWSTLDEYEKDYDLIRRYFDSPRPKEDINIEIDAAKDALREIFLREGEITYSWFDYQNDFLNAILPADKDILVTLPTGGGKSVLFQAPALYRGSISGRLTIVITPLKALMEDHVNKLWNMNFFGSVEFINRDRKDTQHIYRRIAGGEILLLYITPERFRSKSFINALKMRIENDGGLEYAVYDEAHCVSQWGLDFRPDYLNSANINRDIKEKSSSKFPLLLFSATVSEQIYKDFQERFNNSINRLNNYSSAYNPLREHIAINFHLSENKEEKISGIAQSLIEANFNPLKSRCLIFVRRRKDAEENVKELENKLNEIDGSNSYTGRVSYFHAGMNAEERQEIYNSYKSGETYILLATKAFGMGMDIPNIHYVYHYGPSGTLEDYLQEVGRAGRNARQLMDAGFSNDNPIQTVCFLEKEDFKKLKTLLQNGKITWTNLLSVYTAIKNYYSKFRNYETEKEKPIILPFNILSRDSSFEEIQNKDAILRLSLYWLEKLDRIKLGFYAPGQLEFSEFKKPPETRISSPEEGRLLDEIKKIWDLKDVETKSVSIEMNRLLADSQITNSSELLKIIFNCQKKKYFIYDNIISVYPTKKKMAELVHFKDSHDEPKYSTFEAVFALSFTLMGITREKEQIQFDGRTLEEQKKLVSGNFFSEELLPWCKKNDSDGIDEKMIQKEQKDFELNKAKFAFTLCDFIPRVRHQTLISHRVGLNPEILQLLFNGCKKREEWQYFLNEFRNDFILLLKHVSNLYISSGNKKYNFAEFILQLNLQNKDPEYIENLFAFANWLGYLHYEGTFLPMGVEMYLKSKRDIRHEEVNSSDNSIYEEFETTQKLRELRLIALECLTSIKNKRAKDQFITDYFKCGSPDDIILLLVRHLGNDHDALKGYRDEALKEAVYGEKLINGERKGGLSEEQLKVYEADIHSNVQVIAGPGSGKTHTLILRVARLIHNENIRPENILVLAYNRAVVVELKERLLKLFSRLGYANIIQSLKVFTFHGFCKYCLGEEIHNLEFKSWVSRFFEISSTSPGLISSKLGVIKYVFVDEFQDITGERLRLLALIANPKNTFTTVIGDPNQSIYGYERVDEGGSRSPKPNYDSFEKLYKPIILRIGDNFRSYPSILTAAEKLLNYNQETFGFVPLRPTLCADHAYREIIKTTGIDNSWLDKLGNIIEEINPATQNKYRGIAIMFRRNIEVYRAYNLIEEYKQNFNWNVRIRIQGENEDFSRTREIAWIINMFYGPILNEKIQNDFIDDYRSFQAELRNEFPEWDFYYFDFFECLLREFSKTLEDDYKYADLIEFIQELTQKDDGQLSKIFYNHIRDVSEEEPKTEIVLTTMHKVKGLEFDAVIIPASLTNLPFNNKNNVDIDNNKLIEIVEEERRLMYVSYTRAKFRLVAYHGDREVAMVKCRRHEFREDLINTLGIPLQPGIDKLFISWGASNDGNSIFDRVERTLKLGNKISLKKGFKNWFLYFNDLKIGCLSNSMSVILDKKVNGCHCIENLRVANISRWTVEDTIEFDKPKPNQNPPKMQTNFIRHWTDEAKRRGYIYLVDFSGFGRLS